MVGSGGRTCTQRGQCRRAGLGLGGGVLDRVGHPVGQDQGQRAEDVGRPGRVGRRQASEVVKGTVAVSPIGASNGRCR